jgi:DNA-binding Xre family transcriptional regulator
MPKKAETAEDHLQTIEYLLAGILLKRDVDVKKVAKIIGCSDKTLSKMYPKKPKKRKSEKD